MKILIGTDTYPPTVNGAAQFSQRLARGLAGRGHEVHVVCPSPTGQAGRIETDDGIVHHRVRSFRYPKYDMFAVSMPGTVGRVVRGVLDDVRPDVVHVQDFFLIGRSLLKHARNRGIGAVATNHLMPQNVFDHLPVPAPLHDLAAKALWWDLARIYRKADVVTSPTPRAVDLLRGSTGLQAIAVSNGIDLAPYLAAAEPADGDRIPVMVFVGRLDPEKRVGDLLRAMARLPAEIPGRLEIVGEGSERAVWQAEAQRLGLNADRVVFRGFLPDGELLATYRRADVFCMPGIAELQSLATLEAMASGTPVIAADAMALPHLVHHGQNGYLYTPGNISELSGHLATLLQDPGLRHTMGDRSRELVTAHSIERTLETFESLYAQVSRTSGGIQLLRRAAALRLVLGVGSAKSGGR
ncbi:GDP-mannose-dependent alpha-mannosyltransferase [Brevibacterium casei]|uniref:D-inositol 3-phosphate glycosyltransferase n=1 Tax=Brevibacterium casei TaxID=33889 RepID=A0A449D9R2_9MICO|nr:glycosyltransferase [Brevibacterium casei]VEW14266.1 GDP-mannose-dependent alpha-mannosyltransferase [Brevibacterium casei]